VTVPYAAVGALAGTVAASRDRVVPVPVDLDIEARLVGAVTFRMAGWLALAAAGGMLAASSPGSVWRLAAGFVLALLACTGAFLRPAGRPLMAWAMPLLSYLRRRRADRKARRD